MDVQAAVGEQRCDPVNDRVIGKRGNLPCIPLHPQRGAEGLHFEDIRLERSEALTEKKAIRSTKVRVVISALVLVAIFPIAGPIHSDRLCGNYIANEEAGLLAPEIILRSTQGVRRNAA